MSRDVDPPANPYMLVFQNVVEESFQGGDTSGASDQSGVQSYRQHFGGVQPGGISFAIERIERVACIVKELCTRVETLHGREAHIIAVECIGHYLVRNASATAGDADITPIGEVVSVRV